MQTCMIPDGFEPVDDMPHQRPDNTPNWSESCAVWAYMENQYLYMHFQRHPDDSGMWRAYATILGEDGSVLATHNFGRQYSESGPGYQQVHCVIEKPFELFQVKVDALAQISDWATLRKAPLQSLDGKITPLQIDLRFTSISPTNQLMPQDDDRAHSSSKWTHYTPCRVEGYITIGSALMGLLTGDTAEVDLTLITAARRHIVGVNVGNRNDMLEMCKAVTTYKIRPIVDKVYAFEDAAAALADYEKKNLFSKYVIKIGT